MKASLEKLKEWAGVGALAVAIVGGIWAFYRWRLTGADDWMVNVDIASIAIEPYGERTRMIVVHVKTKNPTSNVVDFDKGMATFDLTLHALPSNIAAHKSINFQEGDEIGTCNLLSSDGTRYMPGAEFDDTCAFVVPTGTRLFAVATLARKATARDKGDEVSAARYVAVPE